MSISLHVPLSPQTRHLIDRTALSRMKRSAYLINTSRGPVVDEDALAWALREGIIKGAGLDVYEDEPKIHPGLLRWRTSCWSHTWPVPPPKRAPPCTISWHGTS